MPERHANVGAAEESSCGERPEGVDHPHAVSDHESAQALRFLGSPTVRINGIDIKPPAHSRSDFGIVLYESGSTLIRHEAPERSMPGVIVAAAAVVVMPVLAKATRRVAAGIGSGALKANSKQADFCAYLSAIVLGGLLLNAVFGWWWADPVAGLVMVPIIAKEGVDGLMCKACCDDCGCR